MTLQPNARTELGLSSNSRPTVTDDESWQAVLDRDPTADGRFVYSVATTGVYCRPSCGARRPLRKNVGFHTDGAAARRAGFRPCKRCRPDTIPAYEDRVRLVTASCRAIETAQTPPSLAELADAAGLSRFHFHRLFKAATGVTPKKYADAVRADKVRHALAASRSVTEAIYDAGFNSSGRFYETAATNLGMRPAAYRAGGRGATIRFAIGQSSLGAVLVAATENGVCAIEFGDAPDRLTAEFKNRFRDAELIGHDTKFAKTVARIVDLIEMPANGLDLPLDIQGTLFQQRVWQALRAIPPGETRSYAEIARAIGKPKSVRAVAQACATNPVAVAVPCHRVVRSDGAISGYRWGVARKRALLARESGEEENR
jgi:AraC family transcriptional regulator of adaptative response/methylated-DNA-[protein]-cysteine methyltransferase